MRQMYRNYRFVFVAFSFSLLITSAKAQSMISPKPVIQEMLADVDVQRWYTLIEDLVRNEDLDTPGHFFESRYALRVRDAVQHDGKEAPDDACDNAAEYIARQFESYGLEVEFDTFSHRRITLSGTQGDYLMRNVIATLPGNGPHAGRVYLVTGHYDSIASRAKGWEENWRTLPAPGATDNASGVAEILEIARILSRYQFDFTIQFIAFSGEELGLFGSKHYAEVVASQGQQIAGVIDVDQLGHDSDGLLDIHVLANQNSAWLMHAFETVHDLYRIDVELVPVIDPIFVYSDHAPFWAIGVPGVMVAEESSFEGSEWPEHAHSPDDTLDKLSLPLGERAIELVLATVAELASPMTADFVELPDLQLVEVTIQDFAGIGDIIPIEIRVMNASDTSVATSLWVQLITPDGSTTNLLSEELTLAQTQTQNLDLDFQAEQWGIHRVRVSLNPTSRLFESDFSNNVVEHEIVIVGGTQVSHVVAYPNPFRPSAPDAKLHLRYELGSDAQVEIQIYNLLGQSVNYLTVSAGEPGARIGPNEFEVWDGRNSEGQQVAPGVYFCTVSVHGKDDQQAYRVVKIAAE